MAALAMVMSGAGCAHWGGPSASDGRAAFAAMQQAVVEAGRSVGDSLVLVTIQREAPAATAIPSIPGLQVNTGGPRTFTGVVLTPEGHLLVPELIRPDTTERIEAHVGGETLAARPIKTDDTLVMTVLKVDVDTPLKPLRLDGGADLAVGEWGVVVVPSDEATDFEKFTHVVVSRGEIAGRYRRFLVSGLPREAKGAPVVNLSGQVVGLLDQWGAVSAADLKDDVAAFLAQATGVRSPEEESRTRGWIGATLEPVNKELALARGWPVSALWVTHAAAGGPAAAAGVRVGDLIVAFNGKPLRLSGQRARDYFLQTMRATPGVKFTLTVLRGGRQIEVAGEFTRRPEPETLRAEDIGVTVQEVTDSLVFERNLLAREGVLVTEVHKGSPAATGSSFGQGLLMSGDVILELAGKPTADIKAFGRALDQIRRDRSDVVLVKLRRGAMTGFEGLNLKIGDQGNGGRP
jgi:serine protease Do